MLNAKKIRIYTFQGTITSQQIGDLFARLVKFSCGGPLPHVPFDVWQYYFDFMNLVNQSPILLKLARSNTPRHDLLELFLLSSELKTTDGRDRVYGLLGLAADYHGDHFDVDYSLSLAQTYYKVMRHRIRTQRSLDFLCFRALTRQEFFPTWLPSPERLSSLLEEYVCASNTTSSLPEMDPTISEEGVIRLRGMRVDRIRCSTGRIFEEEPFLLVPGRVHQISSIMNLPTPPDRDIVEYTMETLLELWCLGEFPYSSAQIIKCLRAVHGSIAVDNDSTSTMALLALQWNGEEDRIEKRDRHLLCRLSVAIWGSTFVGTEQGKFGLCFTGSLTHPPEAGDEIWILFGCPMPMVLRQEQSSTSSRYRVIGPAVFRKVMDGKIADAPENEPLDPTSHGLKVQDIELI